MTSHQASFKKDYITLKNILRGAKCFHALRALEFAEEYHQGFRKDGVTPSFHHQVKIAFTLYDERDRIEAAGLNLDEIIAEGILHDTYEDNPTLQLSLLTSKFNARITQVVTVLAKVRGDCKIPTPKYYEELLQYPEAIIVKLHDRRNNVETITELPPEKQVAYVPETRKLLAVAKKAIDLYPKLEGLIQHSRKQLSSYLTIYEKVVAMMLTARGEQVVHFMREKGMIQPAPPTGGLGNGRLSMQAAPTR